MTAARNGASGGMWTGCREVVRSAKSRGAIIAGCGTLLVLDFFFI